LSPACGGYSLAAFERSEASVPQRRLVIVMASDRKPYESESVEISEEAERELKKTINQAKAHEAKSSRSI
jgi:hypothetical protein